MKGLVFNIQRYSIHDGKGIRTLVFFKGCPLRCPWCSNPESQSFEPETVRIKDRCLFQRVCSMSESECPSGAITTFGTYKTVEDIMVEVAKDSVFYSTSGGGVTLSGGEVLSQWQFALELLKELKASGIDTAIETTGAGSREGLRRISQYLDTILFDFKIWDTEDAQRILNANMHTILSNFEMLLDARKVVIPRIPLIPGYTMTEENIGKICSYLKRKNILEVHLLPFHQYGSRKYEYLEKTYLLEDVDPPTKEVVNQYKQLIETYGLQVVVGGLQ